MFPSRSADRNRLLTSSLGVRVLALTACCLALAVAGCGDSSKSRVSGTVTFQGKPIPKGKIYFTPDAKKSNTGPTGYADIVNGSYDTGSKGSMPSPTGAVVVRVEGFEDIQGTGEISMRPLFFPWEKDADLPGGASTQNFDVPAIAAKKPAPRNVQPKNTGP